MIQPHASSQLAPLAVQCTGLTKHYGVGNDQVVALRGVDLDIAPSEMFMLVGPSGCGKTTLISILAGILDQSDGQCHVFGHDWKNSSNSANIAFRAKNIGFVFQSFNLLPALNAAENVAVPLIIQGTKRREALDRARAILERVGLGQRWKSRPNQLSGGQQQRVAIARALVHNPRLVVCDEPTSALDHETGQRVIEMMREVALDGGRTLIIVTHDNRIFNYADRIAMMDDGRVMRVVDDWQAYENANGAMAH